MTPEKVALMRSVRRLLRRGLAVENIKAATGADYKDIALQRRLMTLSDGGFASESTALALSGRTRRMQTRNHSESRGDLVDILATPASVRDLRYWGEDES